MKAAHTLIFSAFGILLSLKVSASQPIQIDLQQVPDDKSLTAINVEIGGYDVTHLSIISGNTAVINLETALSAGEYNVAVLAYYEDGEIRTIAEKTILIEATRQNNWQFNTAFNANYRIAEDNNSSYDAYRQPHGNAAIDGDFVVYKNQWSIEGGTQLVYDSNTDNNSNGEETDLPSYRLGIRKSYQTGESGITVGNSTINQESLLFSSYQRRGVMLDARTTNGTFSGSLFSFVSDPTTDSDDNLLPNESRNQTFGGQASFSPLEADPERLQLGVGYIDGKGSLTGSGISVNDTNTVYGGRAWMTSLDSQWLSSALWVHLEYARSSFDSDGLGLGNSAQDDNAYKAQLQLNSQGDISNLGLDSWMLTATHQQVGPGFYSIANLSLPGDITSNRLIFSASNGGLSFNGELAHEQTNVDNLSTKATQTTRYAGIDVYYSPYLLPGNAPWSMLGMPSLTGYAHFTDTSQRDSDALINSQDVDNLNSEYSLGVNFNHDVWSWGLTHTFTNIDDSSQAVFQNAIQVYTPPSDTENHLTVLQISWFPSHRLTVTPLFQWTNYEETDNGNENEAFNLGIDLNAELLAEKLFLNLNYSLDHNDSTYTDPQFSDSSFENQTGSFQLTWKLAQSSEAQPAADLFIKGCFGRQDDQASMASNENWQVNLGLALYWADSFNR